MTKPKMTQSEELVSFGLTDFSAGGAVPDGLYRIEECSVVEWDYDGKLATPVTAVLVAMTPMNDDLTEVAGAEPVTQHYSVSDTSKFKPSSSGKNFVRVGASRQLNNGCNFYIWLQNLVNAGFPEGEFSNDVGVFEGVIGVLTNVAAPKRSFRKSALMAGQADETQPTREKTIAVFTEIKAMPGEEKPKAKAGAKPVPKAGAKPAPKAAPKAAPQPEAASDEATELLGEILAEILSKESDGIARVKARLAVFKALGARQVATDLRTAVTEAFGDAEVLGAVLEPLGFALSGDAASIIPA